MANPTFEIPDLPSRWPRRLLWLLPLLPLLLIAAMALYQAQFLAERALRLALGEGRLAHSLAYPGLDGSLRLSELSFGEPGGGSAWLRAERVEIHAAGWTWLLRNALRGKRLEAPLDALELHLVRVETVDGLDPALGDLGPFGLSGAPFAELGCAAVGTFDAAALGEAGLALENRLTLAYRIDGNRLDTRIRYQLEGSASVERRLQQTLAMPFSLLVADQYPLRTDSEQWQIEDLGFGRIRNKRCADRGALIALVDRHVEAVRALAPALGLTVPEEAWSIYRRQVRDGGSLSLALSYASQPPIDGWFERARPAAGLALAEAHLQRGEQDLRFSPASGGGVDLATSPAKRVHLLSLQDTLWIEPEQALALLQPAPPGTEAPSADDSLPPQPDTPASQPAASAPAGRPANSPLVPEARIVVVGEARSRRLEWAQLADRVGARLRITTRTGSTRVVDLVAWSPAEITIRQRIGGGIAESRIQREMFREAVEL